MSEEQINKIREIFYEMRREFPLPTEWHEIDNRRILMMKQDANTKKLMNWFETYLGVFSVGVPGKLGEVLGIHFQGDAKENEN